jgi:hypothetical protein
LLKIGKDILTIRIDAKYLSDELAFVTFPSKSKSKRKGVLVKEASPLSVDDFDTIPKEIDELAIKLNKDSEFFKAFPGNDKLSIETIYTINNTKWMHIGIDLPFTGIFHKIYILSASFAIHPWFTVAFKRKNIKSIYVTEDKLTVKTFLELPLNKTYTMYVDACMAFSKGGFQNKNDRKFRYLDTIYQLD